MKKIFVFSIIIGLMLSMLACEEAAPTATTEECPITRCVYITKTGKKYHSTESCSGLSCAKAIFPSTLDEAQFLGLTPCAKCY